MCIAKHFHTHDQAPSPAVNEQEYVGKEVGARPAVLSAAFCLPRFALPKLGGRRGNKRCERSGRMEKEGVGDISRVVV